MEFSLLLDTSVQTHLCATATYFGYLSSILPVQSYLLKLATRCIPLGVEHLLRNVKDATVSTLATDIGGKVQAVKGLRTRLRSIVQYLEKVLDGTLPVNHEVMQKLQVSSGVGCWDLAPIKISPGGVFQWC